MFCLGGAQCEPTVEDISLNGLHSVGRPATIPRFRSGEGFTLIFCPQKHMLRPTYPIIMAIPTMIMA